jgi:hypothetical protein
MLYYIILYYNIMEPTSYMRSVVDQNFVMRRMTVFIYQLSKIPRSTRTILNTRLVNSVRTMWEGGQAQVPPGIVKLWQAR